MWNTQIICIYTGRREKSGQQIVLIIIRDCCECLCKLRYYNTTRCVRGRACSVGVFDTMFVDHLEHVDDDSDSNDDDDNSASRPDTGRSIFPMRFAADNSQGCCRSLPPSILSLRASVHMQNIPWAICECCVRCALTERRVIASSAKT